MIEHKRKVQAQPMNLIACVNQKNALGKDGELLYRMKQDFEWFKELTKGQIVVMGVNTFKEIGRPLPNRINIVLCDRNRPKPDVPNDVIVAHSLDDVLLIAGFEADREIFIIGGQKLYQEAFEYGVDYIYRTCVHDDTEGDVHFISLDAIRNDFTLETEIPESFKGVNQVTGKEVYYQFEIWKRRQNKQVEKAKAWLLSQKGRENDGLE